MFNSNYAYLYKRCTANCADSVVVPSRYNTCTRSPHNVGDRKRLACNLTFSFSLNKEPTTCVSLKTIQLKSVMRQWRGDEQGGEEKGGETTLGSCILLRRHSEFRHCLYPDWRAPPIARFNLKPFRTGCSRRGMHRWFLFSIVDRLDGFFYLMT